MYPASINLSQILEILPEDKLMVYSAFVRILTNSADAMIVKDELKDVEYRPGCSKLNPNLTGYIKYFLKHQNDSDIAFANQFSMSEKLNLIDYYIFLQLDGKNSLSDVAAKTLKFMKEKNIQTLEVDGKKLTKNVIAANIINYVTDTAKMASILYLLEEI